MKATVKADVSGIDNMGAAIYKAALAMPQLEAKMMQIGNAKAASMNAAMYSASRGRVTAPFSARIVSVPRALKIVSISMPRKNYRGKEGMASLASRAGVMRW